MSGSHNEWMQVDSISGDASVAPALAQVLHACIDEGASLGWPFVPPMAELVTWWQDFVARPDTLTWVARVDGQVVGTVSLVLAGQPNGQHRADVVKLLVRPDSRGRGVGAALMTELEQAAADLGRTTLVLDTVTASPAEALYAAWGWDRVGVVPDFALTPEGLVSTTFFTKRLG